MYDASSSSATRLNQLLEGAARRKSELRFVGLQFQCVQCVYLLLLLIGSQRRPLGNLIERRLAQVVQPLIALGKPSGLFHKYRTLCQWLQPIIVSSPQSQLFVDPASLRGVLTGRGDELIYRDGESA